MPARSRSLQQLLAEAERERARLQTQMTQVEREIQAYRDALRAVGGLQLVAKSRTVSDVDATKSSIQRPGRTGRPLEHLHPFTLWLHANGKSLTDWARENMPRGEDERPRVQSWVLSGKNQRPIPMEYAKLIEEQTKDEHGIPAIPLSTWGDKIR